MRGKRVGLYLVVGTVPLLLGGLVQQSIGKAEAEESVKALERAQADLVEENKKLAAALAALESAKRTDTVAAGDLGLAPAKPAATIRVELQPPAADGKIDG